MHIESLSLQQLSTKLTMEDAYNGVTLFWYPNTKTVVTTIVSYGEPTETKTQSFASVEEAQAVLLGWLASEAFGFELI